MDKYLPNGGFQYLYILSFLDLIGFVFVNAYFKTKYDHCFDTHAPPAVWLALQQGHL